MLLRKLRLSNYGGIYNGMGLNEITIDFTKCRNRIVLIKGDNGSGKSTIVNAMKPLPDNNTDFIPGLSAYKEIEYIDEITGIVYRINFVHGINKRGDRENAKGYFSKILNGKTEELNPSGNITSCKSIIFEQLQLDSSYMTLMQLSSGKRGLADMRPADRKKFVTGILNNVEVYNNMYKKLGKKSTVFKGLMNSIVSKLNSIGNIDMLRLSLTKLEEEISELNSVTEHIVSERAIRESALRIYDPDGNIIHELEDRKNDILNMVNKKNELAGMLSKYSESDIKWASENSEVEIKYRTGTLVRNIDKRSQIINKLLNEKNLDCQQLSLKSEKYKSLMSDVSLEVLTANIKDTEYKMDQIKNKLKDLKIKNLLDISKDEFNIVIGTITNIKDKIQSVVSNMDESTLMYSDDILNKAIADEVITTEYKLYNEGLDIKVTYQTAVEKKKDITELLSGHRERISMYRMNEETIKTFKRPSNCNNDSCPFISNSLNIVSQFKDFDLDKELAICERLEGVLVSLDKNIITFESLSKLESVFKSCVNDFNMITDILSKFEMKFNIRDIASYSTNSGLFTSSGTWCRRCLDDIFANVDKANMIEEYKVLKNNLDELNNQYYKYENQSEFVDILCKDIAELNKSIDSLANKIEVAIEENRQDKKELNDLKNKIVIVREINELNSKLNEAEAESSKKIQEYRDLLNKQENIVNYYKEIDELNIRLAQVSNDLKPKIDERDNIKYLIKTAEQYLVELEDYKKQAEKIEVIKHYTSPTTGIQLLFASMYLNKIMDNANALLSTMFDGEFYLMPFVITENEFRIPVAVKNGLNHDDITSMSSAQIALISMVISISMLAQTSTKLNIINGDEIDGPFDTNNRRLFFDTLISLMNNIGANQCVLISHNTEYSQDNCDIIQLKTKEQSMEAGNIIWEY